MSTKTRKKSQHTAISLPLKPLVLTVMMAVCGGLISYQPAQAQTPASQDAARQYNVPAAPLAVALNQIARQAGIALTVNAELVGNATSSAVAGTYTPRQALQVALQGTGLMLVTTAIGSYSLQRIPESEKSALSALPEITVTGAASNITEGSNSYTTKGTSSTSTRLGLTLRETPQSVSVMTRKKMDDENAQSLDEVAQSVSGLSYTKMGTQRSYYYARGFLVNDLQYDGIPVSIAENYSGDVLSTANLAIYDRIEIVRGANGLMQGTGNPSAAINMVRKRPTQQFQFNAEAAAGSWDNYRSQVDVSGAITDTLRGRAVVAYNKGGSFRDGANKENRLLYVIGEADLGSATVLSLGATIQDDNHQGYDWGGLNTQSDGSFYPLSRSTSLAGDWAHLNKTNHTLFSDIKHQFGNGWQMTLAGSRVWSTANFFASYPARTSATNYNIVANNTLYDNDKYNLDLYANGPFTLLGREHQLSFGASYRKDVLDYTYYTATNNPNINIIDFDRSQLITPNINYANGTHNRLVRNEHGLFGATRLNLSDSLKLILGARLSWSAYDVQGPWENAVYKENAKLIPYAGFVYDITQNHALYASVTEIYQTQSTFNEQNQLLKPVTGRSYEAGVKSTLFDGNVNASLAVFQVDQTNLSEATGQRTCGTNGASNCYREAGKIRSRGIDMELAGELSSGWNASIGYTFSNPSYAEGAQTGKAFNTYIPRRLLKLSTDYRLPGALSQLRIGGNIHTQSKIYNSGTYQSAPFNIVQGGYTLVHLHANYQISRNLDVQLNINNLFDKHYYQSLAATPNWGGLFFGEPRNFMLTLRYKY